MKAPSFKGFRIEFDPWEPAAVAKGPFWNRRIVVGPSVCRLPKREQQAVLCHEVGHFRMLHIEKRWMLIPIFWTKLAWRIAVRQEFLADEFAVLHGYGAELIRYLCRSAGDGGNYHPTHAARVQNIRRLREKVYGIPA